MKILFLIDNVYRGGKERRMIELLKGLLATRQFEPELIVFSGNIQYQEIFDLGIAVHTLPRRYKKDPFMFLRFYRLCRQIRPGFIQSWGAMANIYAIPAAKVLGLKLINSCIADAPMRFNITNKKHLWTRLSFPFSDVVIGNSLAGMKVYGAPPEKSRTIYNGFDFRRIQALQPPGQVREELGIGPGQVVGMVGAFYERKDYECFIRAALRMLDAGRDLTFLAIGDGPTREACQALIPAKFRDRILLPGQIQGVESVIQLFDVGVLSTNARIHGEGISNAVMEYMVLGKPVVATHGGGTPEIVEEGVTGFLVPPQSPSAMADRIAHLLDHPKVAAQMGARGKARIEARFSLEQMTTNYINIYRELAGN